MSSLSFLCWYKVDHGVEKIDIGDSLWGEFVTEQEKKLKNGHPGVKSLCSVPVRFLIMNGVVLEPISLSRLINA